MIGWYVHHHGQGHLQRALAVAAELTTPVVGLSTLAPPGGPFAGWVRLPPDRAAGVAADPTAGGALHWAPRRQPGVALRTAALATWIAEARPQVMVVDVSVEAALTARLTGVPVVVVAMPGRRGDDAHQLAYRVADRILAFWPREVYDPPWLHRWEAKTHWLGAVSRYDGRPPGAGEAGVVLLEGTGADGAASPRPARGGWRVLGRGSWEADPWPLLRTADVVVTHAGQNALAEVAAARRPAVVIPADRPFGEQRETATALGTAGLAVVAQAWPEPAQWPVILDRARALGGDGWRRWSTGSAASAAAAVVGDVHDGGARW